MTIVQPFKKKDSHFCSVTNWEAPPVLHTHDNHDYDSTKVCIWVF